MHDDLLERLPRHVLHHDEEHTVLLLRREDGDDVWMVHRGEKARLLQHLGKIQVLLVRDLECDLLVDPRIFGKEHAAEAAAAERRKDSVLPYGLALEKHVCGARSITVSVRVRWCEPCDGAMVRPKVRWCGVHQDSRSART